MNYTVINNSALLKHRGSIDSVASTAHEVLSPHYQKRGSLDGQKGKTHDSNQLKWPSLFAVFKWRQSLEKILLKKHKSTLNCFQVM